MVPLLSSARQHIDRASTTIESQPAPQAQANTDRTTLTEPHRVVRRLRPLNRESHTVARCTVERLIRDLGLRGVMRGRPSRRRVRQISNHIGERPQRSAAWATTPTGSPRPPRCRHFQIDLCGGCGRLLDVAIGEFDSRGSGTTEVGNRDGHTLPVPHNGNDNGSRQGHKAGEEGQPQAKFIGHVRLGNNPGNSISAAIPLRNALVGVERFVRPSVHAYRSGSRRAARLDSPDCSQPTPPEGVAVV